MSPKKPNEYLKLAKKIVSDERDGIERRYEYGAELLKAREGRQRLPKGFLADRVAEWERSGLPKISEGELQRYMRLAEAYPTKAHRRHAMRLMGSWFEIVRLNFPEVEVDLGNPEPEELEALGISPQAPDEWEQLSLIPGLAPTLKVGGREVPLEEATVSDVEAYAEMYRKIHANYAKRLALIEQALIIMRDGNDDPDANALNAWRRGIAAAIEDDESSP